MDKGGGRERERKKRGGKKGGRKKYREIESKRKNKKSANVFIPLRLG